jgi:hypothetical protein
MTKKEKRMPEIAPKNRLFFFYGILIHPSEKYLGD